MPLKCAFYIIFKRYALLEECGLLEKFFIFVTKRLSPDLICYWSVCLLRHHVLSSPRFQQAVNPSLDVG